MVFCYQILAIIQYLSFIFLTNISITITWIVSFYYLTQRKHYYTNEERTTDYDEGDNNDNVTIRCTLSLDS